MLGYLDDLLLLPAGIALAIYLIPRPLREEYLARAEEPAEGEASLGWLGMALIVLAWLMLALVVARVLSLLGSGGESEAVNSP